MTKTLLVYFILAIPMSGIAQLNFYFSPEIYGRNIDGLGNFQVQNLSAEAKAGFITITATETSTGSPIVVVKTGETLVTPGITQLPRNLFLRSTFNFFNNSYSSIANQTKTLPPGEYTFCFRFVPSKMTQDDFESCFDASIQPMVPMQLTIPANQDSICIKRPSLSWLPPMPFPQGTRFRLLLVEKTKSQNAESILMDKPLVLLDNIPTTTVNYPSNYAELQEGKTYCWQVVAFQKGVIISKSEVWEFTVQCREKLPESPDESFRELKLFTNSNYYLANGYLKFLFTNNYNSKKLKYEIIDPGNKGEKVKHLPEVELTRGLNKIDLDLTDLNLESGKSYSLKVYPFNEAPVEVRFVYKSK